MDATVGRPARDTAVVILLNGERREFPQPMTISALLESLNIDSRVVAVEYNRAIIKRARYPEVLVEEGSEVEIVAFVGGGS